MSAVIVISPEELAAIVEAAVTRALQAHEVREPRATTQPEHYTLVEAAQILRCSVPTIRRRVRLRQLEAIKPGVGGTRVLVSRRSVEALLDG